MVRTIRRFAILASVLCSMTPPAFAQPFFPSAFFHSAANTSLVSSGVYTSSLCGFVTPVILEQSVSVPAAGSGNVCTNDTQCTGAGEACTFALNATTGTCSASGHLRRGDIHYVAGGSVDVEITTPSCVNVTDVSMDGRSLTGSGFDVAATPATWSRLSSVSTTVAGQAANRQRIRIQFPNFGDGQSSSIRIRVASYIGGAFLDGVPFTLSRVAAVNAAIRSTVAETRMRNAFVTSLYRRFGDYDQTFTANGERAYDLDWSRLSAVMAPNGLRYRGSDLRIGTGSIVFSTHFKADQPGCDPDVYADGQFRIVPDGDAVRLEWMMGPRVEVEAGGACNLLSLGIWALITDGIADEAELARPFARTLSNGFDADENGRIPICALCRVVDVKVGSGKIEIWTLPPIERVRLSVSTQSRTDATADPRRGLLLPAGQWAPIVGGGSYESCQTVNGRVPVACGTTFTLDMDGLFNWWGSDVPVPNPIACNGYGVCAMLDGRQAAWARLQGVTRDTARLPDARFPAGALLARRTGSRFESTLRARVSNGCVIPPDSTAYRISLGVNDIATPPSGDPPTRGKLDATVLLAQDAVASARLFGTRKRCEGNSIQNLVWQRGTSVRSR